ncbi:MAG: alpha-amylase family glycosyl hydrolase [Bacteroidota bacterium]
MKKYTYIFPVLLFLFACNRPAEVIDPPTPPVPVNPPQMGYQQYGTPFIQMPATEDVVMYEVNLRAFSQEGTIEEVQARLNQMQALGVNVIWLMPIYPQGEERSVNSPYAIKDFKAVSSEYGDLQSLRTFVDADGFEIFDRVGRVHRSFLTLWVDGHQPDDIYTQCLHLIQSRLDLLDRPFLAKGSQVDFIHHHIFCGRHLYERGSILLVSHLWGINRDRRCGWIDDFGWSITGE